MFGALVAGCTPPSVEPSPTPTGFASEEEAFAAAEATYRAYVDALNEVDLADPATFEPVYAFLDGDALSDEKKSLTEMHANGWNVSGETRVLGAYPPETGDGAVVCLNVADVSVVDANGASQVSAERPDTYALAIETTFLATSTTRAVIARSNAVEDSRCG